MNKTNKILLETIEKLNLIIDEKDRLIAIQDEENNDLKRQLRYYMNRPLYQPLFTWKDKGGARNV